MNFLNKLLGERDLTEDISQYNQALANKPRFAQTRNLMGGVAPDQAMQQQLLDDDLRKKKEQELLAQRLQTLPPR